jgi:hypothetical protein
VIPSSVVVLGEGDFYECKSLESAILESGCRLKRIDEWAFQWNGLKWIDIDIADTAAFDGTPVAEEEAREEVLTKPNLHFREVD